MTGYNKLHLYEEIILLALRDKKGTLFTSVNYHIALGAALTAELILEKTAAVEASGKKKYLALAKYSPTGDELLDECIEKLKSAKRRATIQTWLSRFSNIKNLKHRAVRQLCRKGILKDEEDNILLIFKRRIYPEIDPLPEKKIIERLGALIFTDSAEPEVRTIILLSIANSVGLLRLIFDRKKLKQHKERIRQLTNGEIIGQATKEAIEAVQQRRPWPLLCRQSWPAQALRIKTHPDAFYSQPID